MKMLRKQIALQQYDWLICFGITLVLGVVGAVIARVALHATGTAEGYATLGGLISLVMCVCWGFVMVLQFPNVFNYAVVMGSTRRDFGLSYYVVVLVGNFIEIALAGVVCRLEMLLYPDLECKLDLLPYILRYGALGGLMLTTVVVGVGALLLRFGKKAFWILWCIWMFAFTVLPGALDAASSSPTSLAGRFGRLVWNVVSSLKGISYGVVGVGVVVIGIGVFFGIIRRQQVTV